MKKQLYMNYDLRQKSVPALAGTPSVDFATQMSAPLREKPLMPRHVDSTLRVESTYSLELTAEVSGCRSSECLQRSF
jgi:hypothetical protein